MEGEKPEDKIYWIVSYVQGSLTDKWKERIVNEIFENRWKNRSVEDMLKEIEREFGNGKKVENDIWKGLDSFGDVRNANCCSNNTKEANGKKRR